MDKPFSASPPQPPLTLLTGTVVAATVIGGLYWGQSVLIPVAMAVLLAFLLTPAVKALQRWHLDRRLSIILVVLLAATLIGGIGWIIKVELSSLVEEIPAYSRNIQTKAHYVRELGGRVGTERFSTLLENFTGTAKAPEARPASASRESDGARQQPDSEVPTEQMPTPPVASSGSAWQSRLLSILGAVVSSATGLALALVLVIFMLLEREPLRNRLIRLMGNGRITTTTKALDDAGTRIGRYLYMQFALNTSYGVIWGTALYFIGVDYALLWGFLAAVLRYIPYLGASLGALLPITLSLAQFSSWWPPLGVLGMVLILELIWNNALEPWLYGQSIGVSPVGMLIAVSFWTLLWGPIGLVLSGPLTICLVVLGTHVPELVFFAVLLGDAPALEPGVNFYQRLLARDQDEASGLVLEHARSGSPEGVYDALLVPALVSARRDLDQQFLTSFDRDFVLQGVRELLEDLGERAPVGETTASSGAPGALQPRLQPRIRVLACPSRDEADRLVLEMLSQILEPERWELEIFALETLTGEVVEHVAGEHSPVVLISALPPGGLAHARYLCKRLRARRPDIKIVVGRWGLQDNVELNRVQLQDTGADRIVTSLLDIRKQLEDWAPALSFQAARALEGSP